MARTTWLRLMGAGLILSAGVAGGLALRAGMAANEQAAAAQDKALTERIEKLIAVFADPDAGGKNLGLVHKAQKELTGIGAPAVPQLIDAVLGPGAYMRVPYSQNSLEHIGVPAVDGVRAKWPNLDEVQKWKLMRFRGKFDYEDAVVFAVASLESKNPDVREQAIFFAGKHKETRAQRMLVRMLNTEVPEYHRWLIVESLSEMGNDNDTANALVALLAKDSWAAKGVGWVKEGVELLMPPECRHKVIEALAKMEAKQTAPKLLEVLQEKGPGKGFLGYPIISALANWQYTSCVPELKRILETSEDNRKAFTAARLLQLGDRTGIEVLAKELRNERWEARLDACAALGQYGNTSDLPLLARCLDDADEDVRFRACHGLERITGVALRGPGETEIYITTVPLWKAWWEKNGPKYSQKKR